MKIKRLRPLEFDSSGSAKAKFFGQVATIEIHYSPGYGPWSIQNLICPESLNILSKKCKFCDRQGWWGKDPTYGISLCWDLKRKKWSYYMAQISVFRDMAEKFKGMGVLSDLWNKGLGPDVVIQRSGFGALITLVPESVCVARYDVEPDFSLTEVIAGLESKSVWTKCGSFEAYKDRLERDQNMKVGRDNASDLRVPRADQPREPLLP